MLTLPWKLNTHANNKSLRYYLQAFGPFCCVVLPIAELSETRLILVGARERVAQQLDNMEEASPMIRDLG